MPQNFAEAFREIRTSVMFSSADDGSRSVLVTSTQPSEGKSVVAANLAVSLAHAGLRVLLIDADMRKPRHARLMRVKQDPGLSSLLVGRAKANDVVLKTATQNLWVMPAGPNPPNPAELLGSTRFADLLKTLGEHFDWVVIDSPPVMAVTDASVIAYRTTGVVFVVGSEQVNRHKALTAVQQLTGVEGEDSRRRPEPRQRPAEPVLLLALLLARVRGLLLDRKEVEGLMQPRGVSI